MEFSVNVNVSQTRGTASTVVQWYSVVQRGKHLFTLHCPPLVKIMPIVAKFSSKSDTVM